MAAAAQQCRDSAASKLRDSVRQLRSYLQKPTLHERIIVQKSDKVDIDREELIAKHHSYVTKAGLQLTDDDMVDYIEPKIDDAVDAVDEATFKLEELREVKDKEVKDKDITLNQAQKVLELAQLKLEAESKETVLDALFTEMDNIFIDTPTSHEAHLAETFVTELNEKVSDYLAAWSEVKRRTIREEDLAPIIRREGEVEKKATSRKVKAVALANKVKSSAEDQLESTTVSDTHSTSQSNNNLRLSKMKAPKFSGNIRDFARFRKDFEKIVEATYSGFQLVYVMKEECLSGDALDLVRNLDSLDDIWDRLTEKYGGTLQIVDSVIKDVRNIKIPRNNQEQGLISMIDTLEKGVQDLSAIGKRSDIANAYTVKIVEDKLPKPVMYKWLDEADGAEDSDATASSGAAATTSEDSSDRFEKFMKFLKKQRKMTEKIIIQDREKDKETSEESNKKGGRGGKVFGMLKKNNNNCLVHPNSEHLTRHCKEYMGKTPDERGEIVTSLGACKLCLSIAHVGKDCPWESKWKPCGVGGCDKFHSRTLHGAKSFSIQIIHATLQNQTSVETRTLLLMQEVSEEGGKLFILWDNGSSISLVSRSYARKKKLRGVRVSYELETVTSVTTQQTILYEVPVKDRKGNVTIISAFEMEKICDEVALYDDSLPKLFKGLSLEDVARPDSSIDLLIGSDHIDIHPTKIDCVGKLALFESSFGTGRVLAGRHPLIRGTDKMNAYSKLVAYGVRRNVIVQDPKCIDFLTQEKLGVSVPPRCKRCKNCDECSFETHQLSKVEQKELDTIKDNLKLDPTLNKWVTTYPYKTDPNVLQDNEEQADICLARVEKRLSRNKVNADSFCAQMDDAIKRGVYKEISAEELKSYKGPSRFTTLHEVHKEGSASTPIRVVSNTSLPYKGLSLNDILMKGPNSLADLFSVQLNFRVHLVGAVGDIGKMYHSVNTTIRERHLRKVKWRNMKLDETPKIYGTEVVQFGDKCAAAITTVAMRETAHLFKHIDEEAADKILHESYVDDFATGAEDTAKTKKLTANITLILAKGGFHIKGWTMSGDTSEEHLALLGTGEVGRVLGVGWSPPTDEFSVVVRINISKKFKGARRGEDIRKEDIPSLITMPLTRRILLGITNSIYDIYGFFVPITIEMKIILRETYKKELNLTWDDAIPQELKSQFVNILQLLKEAESLRFRRCISFPNSIGDPELIVFNDGSSQAKCAVAYIRWELDSGEFATQLVAAKARVAPLVRATIPRIEMSSAVLAVRLAETIKKSCRTLNFKETTHISDSKCTIASIAKDSTALKEVMGNCVSEITSKSKVENWFYAKSADNISDIGTRSGSTIEDIDNNSEWQLGPCWLRQNRSEWPLSQEVDPSSIPPEEVLKSKFCSATTISAPLIDINRFRSYDFLMRVTARILRVFERKSFSKCDPTPETLAKAESYWIKKSMVLTAEKLEKGHLDSLRPKRDENGLIVLSTRALKGMKTNYNQDSFPILISNDPLARLWIRKIHFEDHSGVTKTVAKARRKFWIVRARRVAQTLKNSCYVCRLLDKQLGMQQMAPLPDSRLAVSPPFHTTSIDLFGPFVIKDMVKKRTEMKVWGLVATCAATRAVHLDITNSYSTDSILQTLRKFTSLRGCPAEIISDQGAQLVAASKDISDLTKDWNWETVSSWAGTNKIKWKVVPAEAHHHNGLSESMIRSVKRSLSHVVGGSILSFSELQLAMFEIANIINSRPIGIISGSDPEVPNPLTPNDLLLGRSTNEVPQGPFNTDAKLTMIYLFVQSLVDD